MRESYLPAVCACLLFVSLYFVPSLCLGQDIDEDLLGDDGIETAQVIADPFEPINRVAFIFNDKLYFWFLKPASKAYDKVFHEDITLCIANFFRNVLAPVRIVNNLLQGKFHDSGVELSRFVVNTTVGLAGIADPGKEVFDLTPKNEDFGQTLGSYGIGEGVYICWPLLGPSNIRDSVGLVGDTLLNPLTYIALADDLTGLGILTVRYISYTSVSGGGYENLKDASFDPYTAVRDFYIQVRRSKVADKDRFVPGGADPFSLTIINEGGGQSLIAESEERASAEPDLQLNNIEKMASLPPMFANGLLDSLLTTSGEPLAHSIF